MTIKFTRSAGNQYLSAPDSAALTFPNSDWTLAGLVILDGLTTGDNGQYFFSTGAYQSAGSLNVLYQTAGNAAQPNYLCVTRDTDAGVRPSANKFFAGDAFILALHHTAGTLTLRTCKVRNTAPTDGTGVVTEYTDTVLTTALDGSSGLFIGGRADLAASRFADQSLGRFFRYDGILTDLEIAKLAYGMEITDLGKVPTWYIRMDTVSDIQDRGTLGLSVTPHGSISTGTAPAFGYTGTPTTPTVPTIAAAPMASERIWQRNGTSLAIAMSGTWGLTKPDAIEYQLYADDGATVLMPWTPISNAAINADGTWSGAPAVPQGPVLLQHGLYRRRVRAKSGGTVVATADIESNLFGVGDLFGHTGSSSSSLLFTNESGTGFTPAANVRVYHNSNTTWARFGTDGAAILMANILAAKAGVPVGFIAYGWGGTQLAQWLDKTGPRWTSFAAAVAANGGKLAGIITTVGSNDANDGIVVSRAAHLANLRQFFDNHRVLTGQPNLPIGQTGFNRRPSANAQQADWVRQAECIIGDDPGVYHVQVLDLELHTDLTHLSRTSTGGFRYSAERGGNVFGDAIYKGIYRRGPKIISFTYLGNKIYVDLQHRNGTDISPAAAINGFLVSDSSGAALSYSAARDSAGRIVITCSRDLVGPVTVKYLSGSSPVSSTTTAPANEVFDNGTVALPMTVETELPVMAVSTSAVSADLACNYAVRTEVSADLAGAYAVRAQVQTDLAQGFAVRAPAAADLACAYAVRAAVASDLSGAFAVRAPVSCDLVAGYSVRGRVWRDMAASYAVLSAEDFTRAPAGANYRGEYATAPDTVVRVGAKVSAISLEVARRAARVDEGDGMDDEVMLAAAGYTADAEHETQRCFIRQSWRATWRRFPPALRLSHAAPLADVTGLRFYDQGNVLRLLDPRDYLIIADAEPAYIVPAPGCAWPATVDRPGAVLVEYAAGYGVDEASVPAEARLYVQVKVQQQFSPVANAKPQNFDRLLDGLRVYL